MFALTHAKVSLSVFKPEKQADRDLLIVGSILPDVSEFGIADEEQTHTKGLEFSKYLGDKYKFLGLGVISHGEKPHGLDYYTHHGFYSFGGKYALKSSNGFIAQYYDLLEPVIREYPVRIADKNDALHFIAELCFDHITAKKDPKIVSQVSKSLKSHEIEAAVINFANFFNISRRNLARLKHIVNSEHTYRFLENFKTIEGTAHNFQNFAMLKALRDKSNHGFIGHMRKIALTSLGFLQVKLSDRSLMVMFERCVEIIDREYDSLVSNIVKSMKELYAH